MPHADLVRRSLLTLLLMAVGWFTVVYCVLVDVAPVAAAIPVGAVWQTLFAISLWAFFRTMFTHAGLGVPPGFRAEQMYPGRPLADPQLGRQSQEEVSWCRKCESYRLDHAHYCSLCAECVSHFDHHCPWVCNCVGERNHKYFILFLLYTGAAGLSGALINLALLVAHIVQGGTLMGTKFLNASGQGTVDRLAARKPGPQRAAKRRANVGRTFGISWLERALPVPPSRRLEVVEEEEHEVDV